MKIKYLGVTREDARLAIEFQEVESKKIHDQVVWHATAEAAENHEQLILNIIGKRGKVEET